MSSPGPEKEMLSSGVPPPPHRLPLFPPAFSVPSLGFLLLPACHVRPVEFAPAGPASPLLPPPLGLPPRSVRWLRVLLCCYRVGVGGGGKACPQACESALARGLAGTRGRRPGEELGRCPRLCFLAGRAAAAARRR